jgi:hypothetical protein
MSDLPVERLPVLAALRRRFSGKFVAESREIIHCGGACRAPGAKPDALVNHLKQKEKLFENKLWNSC